MDAAVILKAARRRAGLTQTQLAERAATTQSAIAAYEGGSKQPSMATLNRLVTGAGLSVAWSLAPARSLVFATVEAMANSLHRHDEHEALRLAAELWGRLAGIAGDLAAEIEDDPGSTGDLRWDALIGGLVERAAHAGGIRTPVWTAAKARFLDRWWFVTPYRSLHASALVDTPAELANRNVFLHSSSLDGV